MDETGLRRVVVTGAAGRIGRAVTPLLPPDWDVVPVDLVGPGTRLDVTSPAACRAMFEGADAVVHLAANPDPDAAFDELLPVNVVGAYVVAQAAVDCGVRRLVLASSLHAVSGVPAAVQVRVDDAPRPGNLYGATKAWAEALGAWVAATSRTSVVALRLGWFSEERPDPSRTGVAELAAWLSVRDAAALVRAAVEAEGVTFTVGHGVSANRHGRADLTDTSERLGYRPVDDAWGHDRGAGPGAGRGASAASLETEPVRPATRPAARWARRR